MKLSTTLRMEPTQAARLSRISAATKAPQAAIIRDGLDLALEVWEKRHLAAGGTLTPLEVPDSAKEEADRG